MVTYFTCTTGLGEAVLTDTNIVIADFILSTAHKAKGLEFSTVQLTDDYVMEDLAASTFISPSHRCLMTDVHVRAQL